MNHLGRLKYFAQMYVNLSRGLHQRKQADGHLQVCHHQKAMSRRHIRSPSCQQCRGFSKHLQKVWVHRLTYHPWLLAPKIKSILAQSRVSLGALKPVNVAKLGDTDRRGASARRSWNLNPCVTFEFAGYLSEKLMGIGTDGFLPVRIWYAAESGPSDALE